MKPGGLVNLTTGYEKITKHISATNSTWYFEMSKILIKWAIFIITSKNILHSFIAKAILEVYDPESLIT